MKTQNMTNTTNITNTTNTCNTCFQGGKKCQQFYGDALNAESKRKVGCDRQKAGAKSAFGTESDSLGLVSAPTNVLGHGASSAMTKSQARRTITMPRRKTRNDFSFYYGEMVKVTREDVASHEKARTKLE
jgi:hypothetical protein